MIERFEGETGMRLLVEALQMNKMVRGNVKIAQELAKKIVLEKVSAGDELIQQDTETNDIYFIISGSLSIIVNGQQIAIRGPNDHIGEMAAIQPTQKRSATVQAVEQCLVAKITEADFSHLAKNNAELYKSIAQELARRLQERNKLVTTHHLEHHHHHH
uniref:PycTIR n=1 Tax=Pseudovibrio sp. W64 TaxID=1735583 RepID=A0ACD6BAZ5_9HYPH